MSRREDILDLEEKITSLETQGQDLVRAHKEESEALRGEMVSLLADAGVEERFSELEMARLDLTKVAEAKMAKIREGIVKHRHALEYLLAREPSVDDPSEEIIIDEPVIEEPQPSKKSFLKRLGG